jgi:hypothetical protein
MTNPAATPAAADAARSSVHVHGRGELVDVTPYLLGFHPVDSAVVIALPPSGNDVCATVRADVEHARQAGFADYLAALVADAGGRRVLMVVYGPPAGRPPGPLPEQEVVAAFGAAAGCLGMELLGALYVAGGRWWSYDPCGQPACCPPAGVAVGGARSPVAEQAERAGLSALPDRAALAATLDPADPAERHAVAQALTVAERELVAAVDAGDGIGRWRAGAIELLRTVLRPVAEGTVRRLDDPTAARLLVGLTDTMVRDLAWSWTNEVPARCAAAGELWRQLARRAPEPYDAPPLFLTAWAAWRCGSGALARLALGRALAADPEYEAAVLLEQLMAQYIPPGRIGSLIGPCPLDLTGKRRRHRGGRPAGGAGPRSSAAPG